MQVEIIQSVSRGNISQRVKFAPMKKRFPPNNLKSIRLDRGYSRQRLAEMVLPETSQDTIRKLEERERGLSDEWKERLARALKCHPSDFIKSEIPTATDDAFDYLAKKRGFSEERRKELITFVHFLESKKD